jgi:hypothetical protein
MYELLPVLKKLRARPGMYIGEPSLTKLAAFLRGYDYAQFEFHAASADPFFLSFQSWIEQRLRTGYMGWDTAILGQCQSEAEAFERFWQLFDEYSAQGGNEVVRAEPRINGSMTTNVSAEESRT